LDRTCPKTKQFEDEFAKYTHSKYAVALNSATSALHLALSLFNIKGKEVITTAMTFVSTNHAILYEGGIPVFLWYWTRYIKYRSKAKLKL